MPYDHEIFFDYIRDSLFAGSMNQEQVDGTEAILTAWETYVDDQPRTWLAYIFATTYHETAQEMQPIEEYGKGSGMEYGKPDPETGQTYYGRGFVQLTWRDNYRRADDELKKQFDIVANMEAEASNALVPRLAAGVMYLGMTQGWFRSDSKGKQTLERYFSDTADDPYGAREIINGDKSIAPEWSDGTSIGNLIKGYHRKFLAALDASCEDAQTS